MKKVRVALTLVAVVFTLSLLSSAQVGMYQAAWKVHVRFSFHAGNRVMSAGLYRVSRISGAIRVANESTGESVTILPYSKDEPRLVGSSFLRFTEYGTEKFLHDVYFSGADVSNSTGLSKLEIELAKKLKRSDVFLANQTQPQPDKGKSVEETQGQ